MQSSNRISIHSNLLILFFLFEEKADDELLVALGLLLIL